MVTRHYRSFLKVISWDLCHQIKQRGKEDACSCLSSIEWLSWRKLNWHPATTMWSRTHNFKEQGKFANNKYCINYSFNETGRFETKIFFLQNLLFPFEHMNTATVNNEDKINKHTVSIETQQVVLYCNYLPKMNVDIDTRMMLEWETQNNFSTLHFPPPLHNDV